MFERFDDTAATTPVKGLRRTKTERFDTDQRRSFANAQPVEDLPDVEDTDMIDTQDRQLARTKHQPPAEIWSILDTIAPGSRSTLAGFGASCSVPAAPEYDILRTEILQVMRRERWSRIGVVSPTSGCGATFTALNLACGLARIENFRTLLVDLNQRHPGVSRTLDIPWKGDIADFLTGVYPVSRYVRKLSETLGLVMNAGVSPNAADVLHSASARETLDDLVIDLDPDAMIFDLPPVLEHDDFSAFAPNLDGVILVADGSQTTAAQITECERKFEGLVPLIGVVLNKGKAA